MTKANAAVIALGAVLLVAGTATGTVYVTKHPELFRQQQEEPPKQVSTAHVARVQHTQVTPKCDDQNVAGKVIGGIGGGVVGSLMGKGTGKTATTIGGTLAGAYVGGQAIPMQNATCPH